MLLPYYNIAQAYHLAIFRLSNSSEVSSVISRVKGSVAFPNIYTYITPVQLELTKSDLTMWIPFQIVDLIGYVFPEF